MKFAIIGARVLLGLIFVVFGLHGFFHFSFIPAPELSEAGGSMMGALVATGYFMMIVKAVEVVSGLMILTGRFIPLGLILLAPVSVHILLFHTFLDRAGLGMAIFIVAMQLFLAWAHRDSFSGVLKANAKPTGQS
jgi:putative oxidoreductase